MKKLVTMALLISAVALLWAEAAMAMGSTILITPATAAATKEYEFPSGDGGSLQLTGVLGASESITLQRWNGTTWEQLKVSGADAPSLTSTNHLITLFGAMKIRINKPATSAAAGVTWQR